MSDAIATIRSKAQRYPQLIVREGAGWIEVRPVGDESFPVSLHLRGGAFVVHFAGWHETVEREADALNLFAMGLSDEIRLRVTSRGTFDHEWTAEFKEGESWKADSTTSLYFFPYWRRRTVRYLQNSIIPSGPEGPDTSGRAR